MPTLTSLSRRSVLAQLAAGAALTAIPGAASAQATPTPARETPNTFRLEGDEIGVLYASTSMTGEPTLAYRDASGEQTFRGPQLRVDDAPFGTLVTVVIASVQDGYSDDLTLVLPQVNLTDGREPTAFSTVAIVTRHRTTIAGPGMLEGQVQTYEAVSLDGTAEILWF